MKADESLAFYIQTLYHEALFKGYDLYAEAMNDIVVVGKKRKEYLVEVPSQSGEGSYTVTLNVLSYNVQDHCECKAFQRYQQCKHTVAAALHLLHKEFGYSTYDLENLIEEDDQYDYEYDREAFSLSKPKSGQTTAAPAPSGEGVVHQAWNTFELKGLMSSGALYGVSGEYWLNYRDIAKMVLTAFDPKERHWQFRFRQSQKETFLPEIKYDGHHTYSYRCTCANKTLYPMCRHVKLAFDSLLEKGGSSVFLQYRDWTAEKNQLLQPYGLSLADEEAEAFQFHTDYLGNLKMVPPAAYIPQGDRTRLKQLHHLIKAPALGGIVVERPLPAAGTVIDFETGFVINMASQRLRLGFELEPAKVYHRPRKTDVKKLSLNQAANLPLLKELSDETYGLLLQLSDHQLLDYLQAQGQGYLKNYANPWQQLMETTAVLLRRHYISCLQQLWPFLAAHPDVFLLKEGKFSSQNCKPVSISPEAITLQFVVTTDERFITIRLVPCLHDAPVAQELPMEIYHGFLYHITGALHILKDLEDLPVVQQFATGFIKAPVAARLAVLQDIISPLQERYTVHLPEDFDIKVIQVPPRAQVLLKEYNDQYLMLQPQFEYEDTVVDYSSAPEDIVQTLPGGSLQLIKRDAVAEKQFFERLRPLHPDFSRQRQNDFFYVPFNDVMKGNWFLNTVRHLQEANITVKGMQELKRFRYNTHTPQWEMKASSGIDWFDLQVSIRFGDQEVALREVRKALLSKQNMVVLGDGTLGVLPEEWLRQYGMLLKMGEEQKDGSLRLSKLHFTLIDELHQQIDDEAILQEIEAKKQKLRQVENIQTVAHSKSIQATLRPYQLSGFQWLQTLDELGWGGCLADDMGLGKTLQTITFLQHLKEKYKGSTHLVVCPTSLIFNWEAELQKFAPGLRYHVYYGAGREFTDEHFENYDVVITSYGLVRIDMEQLLRFQWHYVVLDESQAIKNPDAQTTKAVQLLQAINRLILSGTPVQNNTFDLYAQFNFLNPGLLGNKEFYKTEFANPIDKHNDAEKSSQLRRLVYPFLLRRTKEQVARDLPDKTETVIWCQMPKEQRSVYEEYKSYYRSMLLKKIAEEGMAKAGIYVLEGLLRLRQICDSPQLLQDAEVTTRQSVKTEELLREIEENTGTHKLLVFSQFTEMLHLVREALQQKGMPYCYLDGSTSAPKRKAQVEAFQSDAGIKVFLISLKAGGVGLNLTAADYVYLLDPWWNPAVEQQAIDRTHRIGQTRKIFAYKMICKDTVEEKILQLQQRKKQLANELVTEDAGFIKKLTREDVEFLFS